MDTHTATIDWGGGTTSGAVITESKRAGLLSGSHAYEFGGIYEIVVTLSDGDGGNTQQSTTALITGVGLNNGVLQIVGTAGKDEVEVEADGKGDKWIEVGSGDEMGIFLWKEICGMKLKTGLSFL